MPAKRKKDTRSVNKAVFIFCEGKKTEPNYFKSLIADLRLPPNLIRVEVVDSVHTDLCSLVNDAKDHRKQQKSLPNDEYWIVVDKDGYTEHARGFDAARGSNISIAFSSICFEYWLLLHYKYTSAAATDCAAMMRELKRHFPAYAKGDVSTYAKSRAGLDDAIRRAQRLRADYAVRGDCDRPWECNPYTNVDELVECLRGHVSTL